MCQSPSLSPCWPWQQGYVGPRLGQVIIDIDAGGGGPHGSSSRGGGRHRNESTRIDAGPCLTLSSSSAPSFNRALVPMAKPCKLAAFHN
ncbi:hypothetical protein ACOMHN_009368 [Nucella lapillus]